MALTALWVLLVALLAWFLGTDPLKVSTLHGVVNFTPHYIPRPTIDVYSNLTRDNDNKLRKAEIVWKNEFVGPESLTFDPQGRGPYTGISDGRVIRWDGPEAGWTTFAITSKNRSDICDPKTPPRPNLAYEHICGRPLGLRFDKKTGDLYIADAYFGIMKVGPQGGLAEPVVTELDGVPFKFANDLDLDEDGVIYFTDSSTKYHRRGFFLSILEGEDTGRFLKYDPSTKETTVLIKGLRFPNGVAISKDGTFLLVAETRTARLIRYWLKGPKAGTSETFVELPGYPDNVRRNENGDFWVALHCRRNTIDSIIGELPWIRYIAGRLPIPQKYLYGAISGKPHGVVIRYGSDSSLLQVLEDQTGEVVKFVSEVEEHDGSSILGLSFSPRWQFIRYSHTVMVWSFSCAERRGANRGDSEWSLLQILHSKSVPLYCSSGPWSLQRMRPVIFLLSC